MNKLIKMDKYIDLIIPRGGEGLIRHISQNATIPVIKHDKGLCHTYIDRDANINDAIKIAINAKCQRTGVCNAMETLLVHIDIADRVLKRLKEEFDKFNTELRGCEQTIKAIDVKLANEEDFHTEYLDNILSIKIVKDVNEAIEHINTHSSGHSEAIITENFSLHVSVGEVVSIVGASGSGKSTLFELITKNLQPLKGEIKSKKISQIFQDPYTSFHPTYTIKNQIEDVTSLKGYEKICNSLELDISLLDEKPHRLSGGQLQRCSILRALLMKPDLLLADEPTSALDNITQLEVMKLLVKFLDKVGILLITHDLDLASWCSDKIIKLDENTF